MAFDAGAIVARMKLDTSGFTAGVSAVRAASLNMSMSIRKATNDARVMSKSVSDFSDKMKQNGQAAAMVAGAGIAVLGKSLIDMAANAERVKRTFDLLLKDPAKSDNMIAWLTEYAEKATGTLTELKESALTLTAVFGKSGPDAVRAWIPIISDISAKTNLSMQETTSNMVRMLGAGAAAADLFREKGILAEMGFTPGKNYSAEETKKRLIEWYNDVHNTTRGLALSMSGTWSGQMSMMQDKFDALKLAIMNAGLFDALKTDLKSVNQYWDEHKTQIENTVAQYVPAALKIATVTAALVALKGAAMLSAYALGSVLSVANLIALRAPIAAASLGMMEVGFTRAGIAGVAMWTKVYLGAGLFIGAVVAAASAVELLRQRWDGVKQGLNEVWRIGKDTSDWLADANQKSAQKDSMFGWLDMFFGGADETRSGVPSFNKKRQILEQQRQTLKEQGDLISAWKNMDAEMAKPGEGGRIVDDIKARASKDIKSILPDMGAELKKQMDEVAKVFTDSKAMDALKVGGGNGEGGIGGAVKKQADIAIDSLDEMAKAGETLYTSLNPVRSIMAEAVTSMAQLEMAGRDDAQTMTELAAKVWDTAQSLTSAQFGELETQLRAAGSGGRMLADELQRMATNAANLQAIADAEEEMRFTLADMRNTPEVLAPVRDTLDDAAQSVGFLSGAFAELDGAIGGHSKALKLLSGAWRTAEAGIRAFQTAMKVAEAVTVASTMNMLGAVMQLAAAFAGMFSSTKKEATSGMAKVMDELKGKVDEWADDLTDKIVEFTKTGKASFKEFADSVIEDALRITVRYALIQPAIEFFKNANGNVFSGGAVVPFAAGGVVSGPTVFPMKSGVGLMGEAGPEAIIPLKRGRDGKLGVAGSGTVVNVIDQRSGGAPVTVTETAGPNGKQILTVMIRDAVTDLIQGGHMDGVLRSNFQLARRPT